MPADEDEDVGSISVIILILGLPAERRPTDRRRKLAGRMTVAKIDAERRQIAGERAERRLDHRAVIAGALSVSEFRAGLEAVGLADVRLSSTHDVADGMVSAIVEVDEARRRAAADRRGGTKELLPSRRPTPRAAAAEGAADAGRTVAESAQDLEGVAVGDLVVAANPLSVEPRRRAPDPRPDRRVRELVVDEVAQRRPRSPADAARAGGSSTTVAKPQADAGPGR